MEAATAKRGPGKEGKTMAKTAKRQRTPLETQLELAIDLLNTLNAPDTKVEMVVHFTFYSWLKHTYCYHFRALQGPGNKAETERILNLYHQSMGRSKGYQLTARDVKSFQDATLWQRVFCDHLQNQPIVSRFGDTTVFHTLSFTVNLEASDILEAVAA